MERTRGLHNKTYNKSRASGKRGFTSRLTITEFDGVIVATVLVLLLIGIIMVFSSSYYTAMLQEFSMFHYVFAQLRAALLGLVAMLVMANINYRFLGKFTPILYFAIFPLLVYTRFFGIESHNARRWIRLPIPGFGQLQTVEFVKIALILFLAFFICSRKDILKSWPGILLCAVIALLPAGLSWKLTSSLSSGITLSAIGLGMIFIASPYFWRFVAMIAAGGIGMAVYLQLSSGYQSRRWDSFLDPWADPLNTGYQSIQSLYAVASGGLFGLGLGNSRQKLLYMVEPHNDFIFAIICEELGFVGAAMVIFLFALLIYRGVRVALNAPDLLGTLIATGIIMMITVQVIINIGVVTNTIPNTGVPLPFISYGGSSILFLMAMVGILLNISRYTKKAESSTGGYI